MQAIIQIFLCVLLGLSSTFCVCQDLLLWYKQPAMEWTEGLPVGNGRLMGMVKGDIHHEVIQVNEETIWTGQPTQRDKPGASKHLTQIRQLMFEGKYVEAERLVVEKMLGLRLAFGMHTYQTLGDLKLDFEYQSLEPAVEYHRELDLDKAIVKVSYKVGEVTFTREIFSSAVDQAIVIRLSCDKPGQLSFSAGLSRPRSVVDSVAPNGIAMRGVALPNVRAGWAGVSFESQLKVETKNGMVRATSKGLRVKNADQVTLRMVAATDYRGEDPRAVCEKRLIDAGKKNYRHLRKDHMTEHRRLFRRVAMNLGQEPAAHLPTDERLKAFRQGADDPQFIALYFQFGRYLLISSSRPGSMAVSLWGKWMNGLEPAYNSDYHININIQMNYWPAEVCNLGECHEPFFDLLDSLRPRGRITARETYNCRGFVAHHATDPWYYTSAIGNPPYGMWPMAPAWSCQHLWEHYLFGGDNAYLAERSYPIMKEAAQFFLDYLVVHPKTGYLVSGPSTSPENRFFTDDGDVASLSMAPTMDNQLINDLFNNCIEASKVLGIDVAFRKQLQALRKRLPPMQIGSDGRLLEWSEEFKEHNKGHRHISHLWGLCPGNQITAEDTPALFEAARKSLDFRVEHGAAASPEYQGIAAWVLCSYTRLLDGNKAYKHLRDILGKSSWSNLFAVGERGRQRKMFETDVNFGATSAIAEMLLQSHTGAISILPALPSALPAGEVKGLRARGAFDVDLDWLDGKLVTATIKSLKGRPCKLKYGEKLIEFDTQVGGIYRFDSDLIKS